MAVPKTSPQLPAEAAENTGPKQCDLAVPKTNPFWNAR